MYKWLVVCLVAIAITKWSQNVQATDDLDDEEKRLLQTLEEVLDQDKRTSDECWTDECFADEEGCRYGCCSGLCQDEQDEEGCMDACMNGESLSTRMAEAAQQQERSNDDFGKEAVNSKQKKWFRRIRIPRIPIRIPRIPIPRIPIRIPRIPIRIPRIPIRIPRIPRIPRIRVWGK